MLENCRDALLDPLANLTRRNLFALIDPATNVVHCQFACPAW